MRTYWLSYPTQSRLRGLSFVTFPSPRFLTGSRLRHPLNSSFIHRRILGLATNVVGQRWSIMLLMPEAAPQCPCRFGLNRESFQPRSDCLVSDSLNELTTSPARDCGRCEPPIPPDAHLRTHGSPSAPFHFNSIRRISLELERACSSMRFVRTSVTSALSNSDSPPAGFKPLATFGFMRCVIEKMATQASP